MQFHLIDTPDSDEPDAGWCECGAYVRITRVGIIDRWLGMECPH